MCHIDSTFCTKCMIQIDPIWFRQCMAMPYHDRTVSDASLAAFTTLYGYSSHNDVPNGRRCRASTIYWLGILNTTRPPSVIAASFLTNVDLSAGGSFHTYVCWINVGTLSNKRDEPATQRVTLVLSPQLRRPRWPLWQTGLQTALSCDYEISFHAILWHIEKVWNASMSQFMRNLSPAPTWHDPILGPGRLHWSIGPHPWALADWAMNSTHAIGHPMLQSAAAGQLHFALWHWKGRQCGRTQKKNWMDDRSIGSMAIWMLYLCISINYV